MEEEINALSKLTLKNKSSSLAILGGAKISTKLDLINSLCDKMDTVILGGGIANTCLLAQGFSVGNSLVEESMLKEALELSKKSNVIIPTTVVTAKMKEHEGSVKYIDQVEEDESIFDIAPESFKEHQDLFDAAGTILWNGPMGLFEENAFSKGNHQNIRKTVFSVGNCQKP